MKQSPAMFIVTLLACGVAFLGVVGFAVVCLMQIAEAYGWRSGWAITSIVVNALAAACVGFGFRYASRQLDRSTIWADDDATAASETHGHAAEAAPRDGGDGRPPPKS
jgi:hypothetical protein